MAVLDSLSKYKSAALKRAKFDQLESGMIYAEIPACPGVWAEGHTKKDAAIELQSVLDAWVDLRLEGGLSLPALRG